MNLDGLSLYCITQELQQILAQGQITKIYQLDGRSLYFRLFNDNGIHHFIITLDHSPRLYVTPVMPATPDVPTGLCMFLRKYYENGRIASVRQLHLDRIIEIDVDVLDTHGRLITRKIYVELMGKYSNIVFTENGIILDALIKTAKDKQSIRDILPKEPYQFPPNFNRMDPQDFTASEIADMMDLQTDELLGKWMLSRFNGMSTVVLHELSYRSSIDVSAQVQALSPADRFQWCRALETLLANVGQSQGALVYQENGKEIVFPIPLQHMTDQPSKSYPSWQTYLVDYEQSHRQLNGEQELLQKRVLKLIDKQKRKIKKIAAEMKETQKMDTYKLYGDLLMIYAYEKHDHETAVTVTNLLSEKQEQLTIPLNPAWSLTDNANRYYKRYTKLRNRKAKSQELHEENTTYLHYLSSLEYALGNTLTKPELTDIKAEMLQMNLLKSTARDKMRKEFSQEILTVTADGLEIWIGRNNRQNDFLTMKKAHPYDLWFHAKNQPGSHVILACHRVQATDQQRLMASQLAAYYSKGRHSPKVEVDCTLCRNVKKPAHAAPGYVIFDNQTTYIVEPKDWAAKN
jgi:predicted ribosome quality control (RQC) complex YloA/Tae2 family protein